MTEQELTELEAGLEAEVAGGAAFEPGKGGKGVQYHGDDDGLPLYLLCDAGRKKQGVALPVFSFVIKRRPDCAKAWVKPF